MTFEPNFSISMIEDKYDIVAFERGKQPAGQYVEIELLIQ
jgi:hypothetical protein